MIRAATSGYVRNSCCVWGMLMAMLLSFAAVAHGQTEPPDSSSASNELASSDLLLKPLHPAKIVIQLVVVGGLLVFWTFRPDPLRQVLQIGITAEVLYAMLQDQISARLCPEYFTVAHPRIVGLNDPTLLGIAWGFLGAWWGGALIGALTGFSARLGSWPKMRPAELLIPFACLLVFQAIVTAAAGWLGTHEVTEPGFTIIEPLASQIPVARHHACYIVSRMHQGTYLSAIIGGVVICGWIVRHRLLRANLPQASRCLPVAAIVVDSLA
ncbi:hypothetical protein [Anatilimnocola floriformis]|uniref:hypothetical protein n=1 Tax=Anatilimnocola floriformis TaxID=2948575 RepID=UPI0020C1EE0A|nr:hypothetical protein [Anatilimnocola floriformis]